MFIGIADRSAHLDSREGVMLKVRSTGRRLQVFVLLVSLLCGLLPLNSASASATQVHVTGPASNSHNSSFVIEGEVYAPTNLSLITNIANSPNASFSEGTALVRANQTYQVELLATRNSTSASGATIKVDLAGPMLSETSKQIAINGEAPSFSYPKNLEVVADKSGSAKFTLRTFGFEPGDTVIVIAAYEGQRATPVVITTVAPIYSVVSEYAVYANTPGESTKVSFQVEDQWGVALNDAWYRVRLTQEIDGFTFEGPAGLAAVTSGVAAFDLASLPTSVNRSALLIGELQKFDSAQTAWVSVGPKAKPVRFNVTDEVGRFVQLPQASVAASVSYVPGKIKWVSIAGVSTLPGSEIKVDGGEALVFRLGPHSPVASGELSLRASSNGAYSFEVASLRDGVHTVSQTIRSVEAKTFLVVDSAAGNAGKNITFDKTSLTAGEATRLTGTLVDENGNAVQTSGAADIVVSWTGAGFPLGVGTVETDAAGKFSIVVLVPASERGSGTITARYRPAGSLDDPENLAFTQTLVIDKRSAVVSANVSSSNGQWIVRVENASGLEVTVRAGTKWFRSIATSDSFIVSGRAQSGTTVPLKVWVDRTQVADQKVAIK